jgi:hypothetical protein
MKTRRLRGLVGRGAAVAAICLGLTILGTGISSADTQPTDPGYAPSTPVVVVVPSGSLPDGGFMTITPDDFTWT